MDLYNKYFIISQKIIYFLYYKKLNLYFDFMFSNFKIKLKKNRIAF